jgi:protein involved in polysaccharide export with SLBB domain
LAAGGLTDAGDINNIEIARRVENPDITKLNHIQTEIIQISPATDEKVRDILLKPYDVINIRQQPGYRSKRTVIVEGMVKIPGRYTLMMNNDRISDLIERAGGFRANADTSAVVIKRLSRKIQSTEDRQKIFQKLLNIRFDTLTQSENLKNEIYRDYDKISINLKEALLKKDAPENMELEDGDVITVERNTSLVKVTGEVYFPTIIPYKKKASLKYYIQKSGSFTQLARRNGTLVIYPDGKAKKVKHFLFFRNYPTVASRSEIFVPQKTAINRTRVTVTEWAVLLSSLGIIANVIVNLTK